MAVDPFLELFTTLFGWQWYGIIWDALTDTGIVYIPFVMILLTRWKDDARGGSYGNVHDIALRSIEIEFLRRGVRGPDRRSTGRGPQCHGDQLHTLGHAERPNTRDRHPALPDSSYGSAGAFSGAPASVNIPVWWYAVLSLTKGSTMPSLPACPDSVGIREVQQQGTTGDRQRSGRAQRPASFITTASSRSLEVPARQTNQCRDHNPLNEYGADDPTGWDRMYRLLYYPNMRSASRITGWPTKRHET